MEQAKKLFLEKIAYNIRVSSIIATSQAGSGHVTSCLSAADILAALFFYVMRYDPQNHENPNNDRFILSKGHAAPALYAVYKELGILTEKDLLTLRTFDSVLEGHPTPRFKYNEAATGSLGQGLSVGVGMAYAAKMDKRDYTTYVLLGDMELTEGSVWEACEIAAFYKLDNLIGIVDCNRLGQSAPTMYEHDLEKYVQKFEAFGWYTFTVDGHDSAKICKVLDEAKKIMVKPVMIIAKTIKGYGVDLAADKLGFHGKAFIGNERTLALQELHKNFEKIADAYSDYVWLPNIPVADLLPVIPPLSLPEPKYKKGEMLATRKVYGSALAFLGNKEKALVSLDAEVKNSTYAEIFEEKHKHNFVQCFIAEQNMVSMAVGMNARGKIPFVSTFACFFSRAYDQIRMAAIGRAPLRLVGSHAGVSIGQDGPSQMGLEDIALMRALPHSVVLYPSDAVSTYKLVEVMANYNAGISYLRTTRMETPVIYNNEDQFLIGGCAVVRQSQQKVDRVCVIAAGITLHEALKAYEILKQKNILISVIDLYSIKPLAADVLERVAKASDNNVITVEDHYLEGGLGEAVTCALKNTGIKIISLAVTKMPRSGKPEELLAYEEIDANTIVKAVYVILQKAD